jgi:hypothetical protein
MEQYFSGYETPNDPRQREYNLAVLAVIRELQAGKITYEESKEKRAEISDLFPEFKTPIAEDPETPPEPKKSEEPEVPQEQISEEEYQRRMNEPTNPWEDLGYRRKKSSHEEIPVAAKSAMNHRKACGEKLSDKDLARFWKKINVKKPKDCWEWINSTRGSLGYGQFRIGSRICDAHRIALELKSGPLKKGRYVCHTCDNPKCCNPYHLFGGTQKENMDDMTNKGRGRNKSQEPYLDGDY